MNFSSVKIVNESRNTPKQFQGMRMITNDCKIYGQRCEPKTGNCGLLKKDEDNWNPEGDCHNYAESPEDQEEFINGDIDNSCKEQETAAVTNGCHNNVFRIGGDSNVTFINIYNLVPQEQTSKKPRIESPSPNDERLIPEDLVQEHFALHTKIDRVTKFPKPKLSTSSLAAMAIKNSHGGCLRISEIYKFISHHFPFYEVSPRASWKNSLRHTLSLCSAFVNIKSKLPIRGAWSINADKASGLEMRIKSHIDKNKVEIQKSMSNPAILERMADGKLKNNFCTCAHSPDYHKYEYLRKGNGSNSLQEMTESAFAENKESTTSKCEMLYDEDVKIEVKEEWRVCEDIPEANSVTITNFADLLLPNELTSAQTTKRNTRKQKLVFRKSQENADRTNDEFN